VRYIAGQQQVMRADMEAPWPDSDRDTILGAARAAIATHDALVISDYAKGFLPPALVADLIALARSLHKPVIVDPKGMRLSQYDGATVITPNRHEASIAAGLDTGNDEATAGAAQRLLDALPKLEAALITRGSAGMTLLARGKEALHIPARAREVFDVSGAGDTVVAALALALAADADWETALRIASAAAAVAVGKKGTASVTATELRRKILPHAYLAAEEKIVAAGGDLDVHLEEWRKQGLRIGFTNGCFDILHPGHVKVLTAARGACDRLVVGLNSDASVKRLKGEGRPVQNEQARAEVLAALEAVDLVAVFEEDTPLKLIARIKPSVLVKGGDYTRETVVGHEIVEAHGGEVMLVDTLPGFSTTSLVNRARGERA
jgi:D-beta-D-heptose 7-phosphate kinase/D-beta-D-heptose 1-phosphate adenosyltransferase